MGGGHELLVTVALQTAQQGHKHNPESARDAPLTRGPSDRGVVDVVD